MGGHKLASAEIEYRGLTRVNAGADIVYAAAVTSDRIRRP